MGSEGTGNSDAILNGRNEGAEGDLERSKF